MGLATPSQKGDTKREKDQPPVLLKDLSHLVP